MRARLLVAVLLASTPLAAVAGEFPFFGPVQPPRRVQVMARRGAKEQAPENTATAIERSIADAVEWVEVDVRPTRDGRHVLLRDAGPDRTLDELTRLDPGSKFARRFAGTPIPTLAEVLKLARGRVNLRLDCDRADPAGLIREVLDAGMERQVVVSGPVELLRAVRSANGGDRIALMPHWRPSLGLDAFGDLRPAAVEIDAGDVTPDRCRAFRDRGIKVGATALDADDRPEVWDRLADAGVDWVATDRPEEFLARGVLRRAGPSRVKVAHHRGASRYAPENTVPSLAKSIRLGADFVEFDVRTARDGGLFLLHDASLDRTTTGRGPMSDRDSSEIAGLDAGAWFGRPFVGTPVPTLDAFLTAVGDRAELYVDAKAIAPEALVAALRAHDLIDRAVVYQGADYLARLKAVEPRLRRMPPLGKAADVDAIADRVRPYAFDTRWGILSKELIDGCHARGIKVFSDAIGANETVESYRRAIRDGIDLIQTDHPVRVLRAIELIDAGAR